MQRSQQSQAAHIQCFPQLALLKQKCRDQRMLAALDFLFAQDLTLEFHTEHLSRHLNLSTSRVLHLFQHHFGCSPSQIVKVQRMQEARKLLESSFKTVKEIMVTVGLHDLSHFVRDFEQMFGQSPAELRKQAHRNNAAAREPGVRVMEGKLRDAS